MCVLPLLVTLVALHGQKPLVSAEQSFAVNRGVPAQASPELSLTTAAARASGTRSAMGAPANDLCADRIVLSDGTMDYDTTGASTDGLHVRRNPEISWAVLHLGSTADTHFPRDRARRHRLSSSSLVRRLASYRGFAKERPVW